MSTSSAVTYTSVSFEARLWSISTEDPYEEASQLEYLEYLAPSNDDIPMKDQPLPTDASPVALSPGYVANFSKINPLDIVSRFDDWTMMTGQEILTQRAFLEQNSD
uniref:Uncharacterized protein n=1 Tax=Tanacetum cinerariifolium TaxID=118510 RepID=A0A6L2NUK1_TANCI|nr:hypothetical protein [Tanacetum cinerariifolium]